jgi:hypothetical protein
LAAELDLPVSVGNAAAARARLEATFAARLRADDASGDLAQRGRGPLPGEVWGFEAPSPAAALAPRGDGDDDTAGGANNHDAATAAAAEKEGPTAWRKDGRVRTRAQGAAAEAAREGEEGEWARESGAEPGSGGDPAFAGVPLSKHRRELASLWARLAHLRGGGPRGASAVDACLAQCSASPVLLHVRLQALAAVHHGLGLGTGTDADAASSSGLARATSGDAATRGKGSSAWHVEEALLFVEKLDLCVWVRRHAARSTMPLAYLSGAAFLS